MRLPARRAPGTLATLLLLLVSACGTAVHQSAAPVGGETTTIYVVRHAERASEEDRDPPLSEAGRARAEALGDALSHSGVDAVYVTQYRRTRETAEPVARRLGLPIQVDSAGGGWTAGALAERVLTRHQGGTVLIVGHSNTVPAIVHAFGGPHLPELETSRYGDLFIIDVTPGLPVRTVRAGFGETVPAPPPG